MPDEPNHAAQLFGSDGAPDDVFSLFEIIRVCVLNAYGGRAVIALFAQRFGKRVVSTRRKDGCGLKARTGLSASFRTRPGLTPRDDAQPQGESWALLVVRTWGVRAGHS